MEITIAILPFKTFNASNNDLILIDGFVEDLIINLSKFVGLSIISSQTSKSYYSEENHTSELQTDYQVKGSFRKFNEQYRIGIQLVRNSDSAIILVKDYDFSLEDLFKTHDDILKQIVNIVQQQIDHDILSFSYKTEQTDFNVYQNYLLGMSALKKGGADHDIIARKYFEAALKKNPKYARAHTGISLSYFNEWSCQFMDKWDLAKEQAQKYALKALELDENDYIALSVAGKTFLFSNEFEKAEHYYRKSLRMNPNDATNMIQIAFGLMYLGYNQETIELFEKARKLNPLHPDSYYAYGQNFYFESGDYNKALEFGEKVNLDRSFVDFSAYMAATYFHLSEYEKMNECWQIFIDKYNQTIHKSDNPNKEEALQWQIAVNPYRYESNLMPFWNHIRTSSTTPLPNKDTPKILKRNMNTFQKTGDLWRLAYSGESVIVPDLKGYGDIMILLQRPEEEIHCSELIGEVVANEKGIDLIDQKAKKDYKDRLLELQQDISNAEELNNYEEANRLQLEYDTVLQHLTLTLGLAGKTRTSTSQIDKARSAVTWRIRNAIKKLEEVHPSLSKHLSNAIKTGTFCSYKPEHPTEWHF